ncbi:hypothetical protein BC835DRAFT_1391952 [Cytidiella melzeri]|nr:hypothetical protein BC835DRAFT_1391952 [Cytidiella melzeri]
MPTLSFSSSSGSESSSSLKMSWSSPLDSTRLRRRRRVLYFACALFVTLLCGAWATIRFVERRPHLRNTEFVQTIIGPRPLPPLYHDFRKAERRLPQHQGKPFANGEKYLWVASHSCCSGWGNVMQDMILTAHLTHVSGRAFVFDDYLWVRGGPAYSEYNGKLIPAHIPMSAILAGPLVGEKWDANDTTPLSISKEYFQKICPKPHILHGEPVRAAHGNGASAQKITDTWIKYLADIDDPCVEIPGESGSIFHNFMFGSKEEILPIWPELSKSPVLTRLGWSSLAHNAVKTNLALLEPSMLHAKSASKADSDPYSQIEGLLAIHVRRGDFLEHCENLGHWGAGFLAFNQFPDFLDPWETPQGEEEQKMAVYRRRCVPTIQQIVDKVERVRQSKAGWGLRNIYIMTNGDTAWLSQLKDALREAFAWDSVATSRDMTLTWNEKYVAHIADMLIGQRAQVFIGNGFSSVTSNVAMIRQGKGFRPESTRMW